MVEVEEEADLIAALAGNKSDEVYLTSSLPNEQGRASESELRGVDFDPIPFVWLGPTSIDKIEEQWKGLFSRIGRMRNLLAVVHALETCQTGFGSNLDDVEVELLKFQRWNDMEGQVLPWQSSAVTLSDGDWIEFRVTNRTASEVDLTILFADSSNLESIYPRGTVRNRLPSGKSMHTERVRIGSNNTPRLQHALILATEADKTPIDFGFLAEPDFDKALKIATDRGTTDRTINSPFGRLLQYVLYNNGEIRGLDIQTINRLAVRKLSWRVTPKRGMRTVNGLNILPSHFPMPTPLSPTPLSK